MLVSLAELKLEQRSPDAAATIEQALSAAEESGETLPKAGAMDLKARLLAERGETQAAARAYDVAVRLLSESKVPACLRECLLEYGKLLEATGQLEQAMLC